MKGINIVLLLLPFLLVFSTYGKIEDAALRGGGGVNKSTIIFDDVNNGEQNVTYYQEFNNMTSCPPRNFKTSFYQCFYNFTS